MTTHRPHPIHGLWPNPIACSDERGHYHVDGGACRHCGAVPSLLYADPDDAILFDACERCAEQAAEPLHLDDDKLGRLWDRMVEVERRDGGWRTGAEQEAGRWLYRLAVLIERTHPGIDPWRWPWRTVGGEPADLRHPTFARAVDDA